MGAPVSALSGIAAWHGAERCGLPMAVGVRFGYLNDVAVLDDRAQQLSVL